MIEKSLQQLRSGLHFSASALKSFLICPWKFRLQYVEGAVPEFRPSSMVLGSVVHVALAMHHRALQEGKAVPLSELHGEMDGALDRESQVDTPIQFKKGEDLEKLRGRTLPRGALLHRGQASEDPGGRAALQCSTGGSRNR